MIIYKINEISPYEYESETMGRLKAFSTTLGWVKTEAESTEAILKIAV